MRFPDEMEVVGTYVDDLYSAVTESSVINVGVDVAIVDWSVPDGFTIPTVK